MASPFTPTIMLLTAENGAITDAPRDFAVEYSDDGTTWTPLQSWAGEVNWTTWEQRRYVISGASPHTYWRINVTMNNGASGTYFAEWALEDAAHNRVTNNQFLDVIPPVSETIGNADAMDVTRIEFGSNYIQLRGLQYAKSPVPQVVAIWQGAAGAVAAEVTIGGATVAGAVGGAGSTAQQNLRALYEAIRVSSFPSFTDWTWEYQKPAPQNSEEAIDYILGVRKTLSGNIPIAPNANVNSGVCGSYSAALPQSVNAMSPTGLTTDLVNGFVYYLQVSSRGIAIATKTNSAYYGPVHACYANNAKAIASLPNSGWAIPCTPIELVVGSDWVTTSCDAQCRTTHAWGISNRTSGLTSNIVNDYSVATPFGKLLAKSKILDISMSPAAPGSSTVTLAGSNLFVGASAVGNDFQIHRVSSTGETILGLYGLAGACNVTSSIPCLDVEDWFKFVGTATDEALLLVADTVSVAHLNAGVTDSSSVLHVASTTGFQASGFLVIEAEIIQYAGVTGTTFTGCTRGKYGTTPTAHFETDAVCQGLWFTKINGGALFCGYAKPS